jgi:tetraacyldisaccharide 4'-kinase
MKQSLLQRFFLDMWYQKRWWAWLLLPVSWVYQCVAYLYSRRQKTQTQAIPVPLVVIGNISVGGTGKTPVIIALANALSAKGISVGVVSRGYGSQAPHYPFMVTSHHRDAHITGDEPLLIAQSTHSPVAIAQDRVAAVRYLLSAFPEIQIILSDDGLQHYRLGRAMEVVVVDEERGLGNHFCLPAGPLREPAKRLASVDWILLNQGSTDTEKEVNKGESRSHLLPIHLVPKAWRHLSTQRIVPLHPFPWLGKTGSQPKAIKAVAGIGNPERFFASIDSLNIACETYAFDDHYGFSAEDFSLWQDSILLMTEKDAVKCQSFTENTPMGQQCWSLIVDITLPEVFVDSVAELLNRPQP